MIAYFACMSMGDALRILRERRGWRQADLAERLGLHQTHVSAREIGKTRLKERDHDELAQAFGMTRQQWDEELGAAMESLSVTLDAPAQPDSSIPAGFAALSLIVPEWLLAHFRAAQVENVGGTDGSLMAAMTAAYLMSPANVRQSLRRWAAWRTVNPPAEVDIAEAAPLMAVDPEPAVFRQDAVTTPSPPGSPGSPGSPGTPVTPQRQKRMERVLSLAEEPVQHDGFWAQVHRMIILADLPNTEAAPSQQAPPRTASGG